MAASSAQVRSPACLSVQFHSAAGTQRKTGRRVSFLQVLVTTPAGSAASFISIALVPVVPLLRSHPSTVNVRARIDCRNKLVPPYLSGPGFPGSETRPRPHG
jgi:hypothetical protein